ncbi:GLIPR1-like protein 2 [Gracilinanus agilis]|uniref:GLIPR1-like protein 2 n=1 Tax=Gracilinanus agilis TaxID=191870 RepID=UPI001CFDD367|nr:GLIPR1-like protein 2 [Gracilinanus agilis]
MSLWLRILCLLLFSLQRSKSQNPMPVYKDHDFIFECVDVHNLLRTQLNPPAANLQYITWDEGLAKTAKAWAKRCRPGHNTYLEKMRKSHPVFNGLGENIWTGPIYLYSPRLAVKSWFSEEQFYDFQTNTCSRLCSSYIQVVWDATYKIGCAAATCARVGNLTDVVHFICNYVLSGNTNRRPYKEGKFCTQCNKGDKCLDMLCSNSDRDKIAHYPFWYPEWEFPRPVMCDLRCLFCLSFRIFLFVLAVVIVFLLQHKFPNIQLEKDILLIVTEKETKPKEYNPRSNKTPQQEETQV